MKLKYLLVPWTAVAVYALSSMFAGTGGILPYRKLSEERELILENLEELKSVNQKLEGTADALLYDSETIRIQARELGYGGVDERFVRIVGLPSVRNRELRPGIVLGPAKPESIPDIYLRMLALFTGLVIFCLLLIPDLVNKPHPEEKYRD
jgi:cell division protein FtsB